jgi:hypothetical protein
MQNETMNTEYHTIDGATFSAADATDLMTQLRADSFNPEDDLPSYCRATARASKIQTGKPHRSWPATALVEDMLASGLIATGECQSDIELEALAEEKWNSLADEFNQWSELGQDEKDDLIAAQRQNLKP